MLLYGMLLCEKISQNLYCKIMCTVVLNIKKKGKYTLAQEMQHSFLN